MRLLELREERNLTQTDVANAIKTSRTNIGRWEKGLNEPTANYLVLLANYFDVSIDYLLGLEDDAEIKPVEFTAQDQALGVGNHSTKLSAEEWNWIELLSELQRVKGKKAVTAVTTMIKNLIEME